VREEDCVGVAWLFSPTMRTGDYARTHYGIDEAVVPIYLEGKAAECVDAALDQPRHCASSGPRGMLFCDATLVSIVPIVQVEK
jgi:hypothetical protein